MNCKSCYNIMYLMTRKREVLLICLLIGVLIFFLSYINIVYPGFFLRTYIYKDLINILVNSLKTPPLNYIATLVGILSLIYGFFTYRRWPLSNIFKRAIIGGIAISLGTLIVGMIAPYLIFSLSEPEGFEAIVTAFASLSVVMLGASTALVTIPIVLIGTTLGILVGKLFNQSS